MFRFIRTALYGSVATITIIDVFGYVAKVEGESMKPTLNPLPFPGETDFVLLNKFKARDYKLNRGEVVCLISPKDPHQRIIKRVMAKEGDTITTIGYKDAILTIPQGQMWVEGDHIKNSLDSNTFGPIPIGLLTAKATHIVWPPSRWRRLGSEPIRHPLKLGKKEAFNNS